MTFPCLTTSWDDGHVLDFRIADLLSKYGLTGTFYIPRASQTPTMSEAQVRELARYFEIGAHTLHHVYLDGATDSFAKTEIEESKKWIESLAGKPCTMFCPPGGKLNPKRLAQIAAAGYQGVRTVEMISVARPAPLAGTHYLRLLGKECPDEANSAALNGGQLMLMPTTLQAHPHSPAVYLRNVLKRRGRNLWLYLTRGRNPDWPKLAESLLRTAIAQHGVFHLWGHSWELEASDQWQRLEDVLKLMHDLRKEVPCVTNGQIVSALRIAA